ncbi:MAG TPA: EAL domain-containing protein [Burkholderiales bacterium]|nr:EAL domain-containing protein [Burkholderiales bacterium]
MAAWLRKLLTAPEYPGDAELSVQSRLFTFSALLLAAGLSVAFVNNLLAGQDGRIAVEILAAMGAIAVLITGSRRGHLRLSSALLPPVVVALLFGEMLGRDGAHDSAVVSLCGTLALAGTLMRWRPLAAFTAATVTVFWLVGYAELSGALSNRLSAFTDARYLTAVSIALVLMAAGVRYLMDSVVGSVRRARGEEERFARMIEATPAATTVTRYEDGVFLEANRAALELFGHSREEVIGSTAVSLGVWPNPEDRADLMRSMQEGKPINLYPLTIRRGNGELRNILVSAAWVEIDRQKQMLMSAVDITQARRAEELLRRSEESFEKIFQASPDAIVISRLADGRYLDVNQSWLELFGFSREEAVGRTAYDLGVWVDPAERPRFVAEVRKRGSVKDFETRFRKKSGAVIDALISADVIEIGGEPHVIVPILDVTDRKRAEERIQQLATRDPLTGLPNRLLLNDRLTLAISNAQRHGGSLALLFIDLDRFKYINDSLGHVIGDAFLKSVAERLTGIMRQGDTLARIGGDEFVVLLENIATMEDAAGQVARKILACFVEPFSVEGHTLSCSCSIGISVFPTDATDPQMLIRDADTAMYNVKEGGRGSYRYFSAEMNTRMQERLQVESGLRQAIAARQFELMYQPKVNIGSGEVVGLEALLRWRHPEWGVVTPDRFIAVAEDTGLIVEIGRWVLEEACRQLAEWRDRGLASRPVAVNLSVRQFTPALVGDISTAMVAHGVRPGQIEVEITESLFMQDAAEVRAILKGLSRLGARVTIDDFGTGYSSLGYIRHFRVDALKIDRAFLSDITSSSQNLAIVRAVITMCRGLGIGVIAEGVEDRQQLDILRKLHCDEYQGYLFSGAVAPGEIERRYLKAAEREALSGHR